ncbi:S1 RNA-binding domain-containing protein [Candidatus Gracilibacteria bacterium]|nr:S1 RNA-binding domain-containing protein [Candidatus Gracilibacteria bacterium]
MDNAPTKLTRARHYRRARGGARQHTPGHPRGDTSHREAARCAQEGAADEKGVFQAYYDFEQQFRMLPPYRVLAINRGESEGVLKVDLGVDNAPLITWMQRRHVQGSGWPADEARAAVEDGYKRLLAPAIERDLRSDLTAQAEQHALTVFAANLRGLLLQPPLRGKTVLGVDPGYRSGCKLAVVDATGKYLAGSLIYLHQADKAQAELTNLCQLHRVEVIAIGNGTASRETEQLVAAVIAAWRGPQAAPLYTMVSEAGASVYSASDVARNEFPDLDATERGNISIARRLQDPLAELVKIDPRALGVGLYQHDVDQKQLAARLHSVVESVVNYVGVDLNTASPALLTYVAGLNNKVAQSIVARRDAEGTFKARQDLKKIKGLGPKAFEQAAGFLRIPDAADPLDSTAIHPESYAAVRKLIARFGSKNSALPEVAAQVRTTIKQQQTNLAALAGELGIGEPTLADILDAMEKPGRDPRDSLPPPMLRADVLKMEDLQPGMWLRGTVRNVVDFGAFVDIGVKQDGLVHVSEMSQQRVRSPLDVVQVGDQIDVRVVSVDLARQRIALSMREA